MQVKNVKSMCFLEFSFCFFFEPHMKIKHRTLHKNSTKRRMHGDHTNERPGRVVSVFKTKTFMILNTLHCIETVGSANISTTTEFVEI